MSTPTDRTIDDPHALFRFALLLTGDASAAGEAVLGALKTTGPRIAQIRDANRRRSLLLEQIRALVPVAPKESNLPAFQELPDDISVLADAGSTLIPAIAKLPDPMRTVAAYFYSNLFSAEELPGALGVSLSRTAEILQQARVALLAGLHHPTATNAEEGTSQPS